MKVARTHSNLLIVIALIVVTTILSSGLYLGYQLEQFVMTKIVQYEAKMQSAMLERS
jgi:hypothetical protein